MADGRKFRYDDGGWKTYKFICPLIHSNTLDKALSDIAIPKGELKSTIKKYHDTTYELWCDTTFNHKAIEEAVKPVPGVKMSKQ